MPREMRVALDPPGGQVPIRRPQNATNVDEHPTASLRFPPRVLQKLQVGATLEKITVDRKGDGTRRPARESEEDGVVRNQGRSFRAARHEFVQQVAAPKESPPDFSLYGGDSGIDVEFAVQFQSHRHANGVR